MKKKIKNKIKKILFYTFLYVISEVVLYHAFIYILDHCITTL